MHYVLRDQITYTPTRRQRTRRPRRARRRPTTSTSNPYGAYNIRTRSVPFKRDRDVDSHALFRTSHQPESIRLHRKNCREARPRTLLVRQERFTCDLPLHVAIQRKRMWIEWMARQRSTTAISSCWACPILFPFVIHPVQKTNARPAADPSFGNSRQRPDVALHFWVPNRSTDVTWREYFSKRGWLNAESCASPQRQLLSLFQLQGMVTAALAPPQIRRRTRSSSRASFRNLPRRRQYRLSEFVHFRIAFTDVYSSSGSEVRSQIFSPTHQRISFNALAERYQNFDICSRAPSRPCARLHHQRSWSDLPAQLFISGEERHWQHAPVWSFESAAEGLQRREIPAGSQLPRSSERDLVGRFDLAPTLSMPLQCRDGHSVPLLSARPFYTEDSMPHSPMRPQSCRRHSDRNAGSFHRVASASCRASSIILLGRNEARDRPRIATTMSPRQ